MVLFEDSAALIGLFLAFVGTLAAEYFEAQILDGVASIAISILLAGIAILLANESKQLLIGEPASPRTNERILQTAQKIAGIDRVKLLFTVHLSPHQIVAALSLEFDNALTTPQIEKTVDEIERAIKAADPDVLAVLVKPQELGGYAPVREKTDTALPKKA
jgi:divalent metal cation (Fe/Co/Zn/Cd) transporter